MCSIAIQPASRKASPAVRTAFVTRWVQIADSLRSLELEAYAAIDDAAECEDAEQALQAARAMLEAARPAMG